MNWIAALPRNVASAGAAGMVAIAVLGSVAQAQTAGAQTAGPQPATVKPAAAAQPKGTIEKLSGVWVEGPGFNITYGKTYEVCAQLCLDTQTCVMIEYYRPEKKCNLYDTLRPRKPGGSSHVGIRR